MQKFQRMAMNPQNPDPSLLNDPDIQEFMRIMQQNPELASRMNHTVGLLHSKHTNITNSGKSQQKNKKNKK